MQSKKGLLIIAVLALVLPMKLALADPAPKQNSAQLKELIAELYQWALSIPSSTNPAVDTTGEYCMVGQHGAVWFLGVAGGLSGTFTVSCQIPEGVSLFVEAPTVAAWDDPGDQTSVKDLRALTDELLANATGSVEVDGNPVKKLSFVQSDVFALAVPADDIEGDPGPAVLSPAVAEGYVVLLNPLPVGDHTLEQKLSLPAFPQTLDVTYKLTVVPVLTKQVSFTSQVGALPPHGSFFSICIPPPPRVTLETELPIWEALFSP